MAKAKADVFGTRLKAIDADIAKRQRELTKLQDRLRADPMNGDLRQQVQEAKRPLLALTDERGFLARAASVQAGGRSYSPEPGNS